MVRLYKLKCPVCAKEFNDDGFLLECDGKHEPALLVTQYIAKQFEMNKHFNDISRYQSWLPVLRTLPDTHRTITYQSQQLCRITKLPHLWIAFTGYWPEKGIELGTTTFKDLEAYTVLSRLPEKYDGVLVVASAGNSAAAFANVCSHNKIPCLIILPASGLDKMQFTAPLTPCVKIVSLAGLTDYYDAIELASRIGKYNGFILEGGVKNVGRRDGLGTTLLSAIEVIGHLPDYYFQAVGSGSGGIAVHEVAQKLVQDGRFGTHLPRLMLGQNVPFAPMYYSWQAKQRNLISFDRYEGKKQIQQISAHVLSNQNPPYSVRGGVFDVLCESQGDMLAVANHEVLQAMHIFQETEGIDIDPAAGVALATLLHEVASGHIDQDATVLLNITGGGWQRLRSDTHLIPTRPTLQVEEHELSLNQTLEKIAGLFS